MNNFPFFMEFFVALIDFTSDDHTYLIGYGGDVYDRSTGSTGEYNAIRPCFYLTSDVTYVSGSGTSYDPIRIQ